MVLPQAMAWVQYWFCVISLIFCRKSKKNCGIYLRYLPLFACMPKGWVHITSCYTNPDQIAISESRLSIVGLETLSGRIPFVQHFFRHGLPFTYCENFVSRSEMGLLNYYWVFLAIKSLVILQMLTHQKMATYSCEWCSLLVTENKTEQRARVRALNARTLLATRMPHYWLCSSSPAWVSIPTFSFLLPLFFFFFLWSVIWNKKKNFSNLGLLNSVVSECRKNRKRGKGPESQNFH